MTNIFRLQIPKALVSLQGRKNDSCLFAFSKNCSIVSKKLPNDKFTIIISSLHQNSEMISPGLSKSNYYYNNTKNEVKKIEKIHSEHGISRLTKK